MVNIYVLNWLGFLNEPGGGVALLVAKIAGLLREAAGVERLGVQRRVRAVELASQWREHLITRERAEPGYLSVADVAARYSVSTQAVYKWLAEGRIEGTRGPGGSWRIPAAQFDADARPATTRERLDALQRQLLSLHHASEMPGEEERAPPGAKRIPKPRLVVRLADEQLR